ncbi:Acetylornithine deacetylase/Succinyl-diaminopimelate desuccinylase-related deacylase [Archaeoglobus sulfaticallidus PM70-1]|uniref:Acetylornithine deacetylase/Succinyl-diaminopimelate desuccinylase-related deacylase n=1 Tax=Archaeoglobus sulfaticallidus PM70-1 TaxID=387631 RepID=N0BHF1_9EURY|nr:M20/M25/M40 family metallo-hydrolase [Archaeoglobus sulfaticallidus]AGK61747.1 Acetylornithine deacetylase/Succinyl-diaminopimelate desuccinylase-related deacylase [Archaeoglobus sulfaticallidus PM70-1]
MPSANLTDPLKLTQELIKIDSRNPPGYTTAVVEFLENIFSEYKTRIVEKVEGKPNLIVEIQRGEPEFMLTTHMDTVPSHDALLNPVIVDGKLYGRGSCDAKGCMAVYIHAALNSKADVGLKLAFTCDEEVGGINGLGYVFEKERADFVLVGEPFGADRVGALQASVVSADITIKGESGHTASKDSRKGAIYRASEYIIETTKKISSLKGDYANFESFFKGLGFEFEVRGISHAIFNPAVIKGGVKRNVVAPECTISADIRFAPWIGRDEIRDAIYSEHAEFRINGVLQPFGILIDGTNTEKDIEFLKILRDSIKDFGMRPVAVCSLGVGDTRHVRKYGVPAFYYGPRGYGLHSDNECVVIEELYTCSKVIERIIERIQIFS